jgi:hypothetical protein
VQASSGTRTTRPSSTPPTTRRSAPHKTDAFALPLPSLVQATCWCVRV